MNQNMNAMHRKSAAAKLKPSPLAMMNIFGDMVPKREQQPPRHWAAPVVTFATGAQGNGYNDSDHLWLADSRKYNEVSRRLFGDESQLWWDSRTPQQVEQFLRDYFDNPALVLVKIQKMYNVSNGGPVWGFSYQTKGK